MIRCCLLGLLAGVALAMSGCASLPATPSLPPSGKAELILASLDPAASILPRHHTGSAAVPVAIVTELAPTGVLRAAINFGNPVLASKDAAGEPRGVSVDLAQELARRLGVPMKPVLYPSAGKVVEAIARNEWDVAFFAFDPQRAADTDFTAAYLEIEGAYLVREDSPIRHLDQVDRSGVRVVVGRGSAYDLYLTRELKQASLVRAATSPQVVDTMVAQKLEVAAGVKQQLAADARRLPGLRVLDGRFMRISQAMALPKGRPAAHKYLSTYVEEIKISGVLADALRRHRIDGAAIAANAN